MARTKIRKYPSTMVIRDKLNNYFVENRERVLKALLEYTGYTSTESLREAEFNGRFGLDCGWVYVRCRNSNQYHEWELDNGKYDAYVNRIRCSYDTQSTTLKEFQTNLALMDLGLEYDYYTYTRLD